MPEVNSQEKPILIIGGSARAAATDAVAGGYCVTAMDHFGDADLRAVCQRWIHLAQNDQWPHLVPDRQLTIVPTGGFDWPESVPLPHLGLVAFPTKSQFDAMRDPQVLAQIASQADVEFPSTWISGGPISQANEKTRRSFPGNRQSGKRQRWLIKPQFSTGGLGIRAVDADPATVFQQLAHDEYLQEHVVGRPIGANFISRFDHGKYRVDLLGLFAGLTYRKNRSHRWLYGGSIGPLPLGDPSASNLQEKLKLLGLRIAERFELVGLFNVDLIAKPDRTLALLEINPRYSASMELMPSAGHLIDWHITAYQNRFSPESAGRASASNICSHAAPASESSYQSTARSNNILACKRIVYANCEVRFKVTTKALTDSIRDLIESSSAAITWHDIPSTDDVIPEGFPILTVIARSQATDSLTTSKILMRLTHRIAVRVRQALR